MLKPLYDNVILKKEKVEAKTASGIIISEKNSDEIQYAVVTAVGDGKGCCNCNDEKQIVVRVGDKVVFKKYSTTDVKIDNVEYMIIACKDILAIIE